MKITQRYLILCLIFCGCFVLLFADHGTRLASAYEITDQDGLTHSFTAPFKRIISLYPAHTENLAAMGAEKALIGISSSDTYPESILHKDKFSYHDTIEKFISARPDCVLIRPMIRRSAGTLVEKLQKFGVTVISLQPTTPEELYDYWHQLGLISGQITNSSLITKAFKDRLGHLTAEVQSIPQAERPVVYFESIHTRMKTFSPDSIAIFCLESAGGLNAAPDALPRRNSNIAGYSKERILSLAHTIDVFLAQSGRMNNITVDQIISEPGFGAIKAIQQNQVYLVDEHLVSRPTPRLLEGISYIQKLLYKTVDS